MPEAGEQFLQLVSLKSNAALTVAIQRLQSGVMSQVLDWKGIRSLRSGEGGYNQHGDFFRTSEADLTLPVNLKHVYSVFLC